MRALTVVNFIMSFGAKKLRWKIATEDHFLSLSSKFEFKTSKDQILNFKICKTLIKVKF